MSQPPNILLVMADQLIPFLMGAYDHPVVQTPHLDSLAAAGMRFDAAYTPYPLCAPARAALLTGRYASRRGIFDNAALFPADEPTLAHYLTNAGYDCVLSGKMHFIGPDQLHGYNRRLTTDIFPANVAWVPVAGAPDEGGHAYNYVPPRTGVRAWNKFLAYDEEVTFRAAEYLRERAYMQSEQPFFLTVSFHHPHDPFQVTPELWALYDGQPIDIPTFPGNLEETYSELDRWLNAVHSVGEVDLRAPENLRTLRRAYYGLVTYIDRKVGQLLAALEESGERDNTIIIFTSDHGDMLGEKGMVQKRCFYEWSARVPLILQQPHGPAAGKRITTPVTLLDLLPTLLELAGVPVPDALPLDGASLVPLLNGGEEPARAVFAEYHVEKVKSPSFMVRRGPYKYVYIHGHDCQLFDLDTDPGEWHNLADEPAYQRLASELEELILARFDPAQLAAAGRESVRRRLVIKEALQRNEVHWDYLPEFDPRRRYVR
ncbi:MAG: choline-sulfatase [Anaerolineae bacterium]|nr:choline-sulfatase [Anaerolineae bacterium]